jgi:methyl-accepting chemotaxis protein
VIQQNAGSAEEMASTAEALSGQAEQLLSTVSSFKISENIRTNSKAPRPSLPEQPMTSPPGMGTIQNRQQRGIVLNMGSGQETRDDEFERF